MSNHCCKRRTVTVIIVLIVAAFIALAVYSHQKRQTVTPTDAMSMSTMPMQPSNSVTSDEVLASPKTIGSFTLTDDNGNPFSHDHLKGHWTFMFFGFSRCGDVCPTTLSQLNKVVEQVKKDLPPEAIPQVVMVTVDPETDTTAVMHNYVRNFNPDFIGATADTNTLNTFSKDLGLQYAKVSQGSNGYTMSHTAELYLFNPDGNLAATFGYPHEVADLTTRYENIVNPSESKA